MLTMPELIKDSTYRKFLLTKPATPVISRDPRVMKTPPWVVYVQKEPHGRWGKKEFWKYSEAFNFLKRALKLGVHDAALHNRRIPTDPPARRVRIKGKFVLDSSGNKVQLTREVEWTWKGLLEPEESEHHWCLYCRRPTVFGYYRKHKARQPGMPIDSTIPRCCICGGSARVAIPFGHRRFRHA